MNTISVKGSSVADILASKRSKIFSASDLFDSIYMEKVGSLYSSEDSLVIESDSAAAWDELNNQSDLSSIVNSFISGEVNDLNSSGNTEYDDIINAAAAEFDISAALLKSVIENESSFNSEAVSSAGAVGLMQLMPGTAEFLGVTDSTDPYQNIMGGAEYLSTMLHNFDGDMRLALAGYNMGGNRVAEYGITPNTTNISDYDVIPSSVLSYANGVISDMSKYRR